MWELLQSSCANLWRLVLFALVIVLFSVFTMLRLNEKGESNQKETATKEIYVCKDLAGGETRWFLQQS